MYSKQNIGEIGKTKHGVVAVTSHLYDGLKSLPLDIELYQKAHSLPEEKVSSSGVKIYKTPLNFS